MPANVYFPPVDPSWDFDRDAVRFYAVVDKATVACLVTVEALMQHFGAGTRPDGREAIRAFSASRRLIEEAARRKIEQEGAAGVRQVVLATSDFPSDGDAPAPGFAPDIAPEVRSDPRLMQAIRATNRVLDEEFGQGKYGIAARWDAVADPHHPPLLRLTLSDSETAASVWRLFTREDLENGAFSRFDLFRLWDDLLRNKGRRQIEALQGAGSEG